MVTAVVLAVLVMLLAAEPISAFVEQHPTIKILALSFLLLIGLSLVADGFGQHISKGYIYFAMGFSVFVEMINIRVRKKGEPVQLHQPYDGGVRPMRWLAASWPRAAFAAARRRGRRWRRRLRARIACSTARAARSPTSRRCSPISRSADVVFVGEQHDDPNTHRLELAVLEGLARRARPDVDRRRSRCSSATCRSRSTTS